MKYLVFFIAAFSLGLYVNAQEPVDVLRISQSINFGTARSVSMGGAFGALGADFSTLSNNPAGLGVYRSSEFTISSSLKTRVDEANYLGTYYSDSRSRFIFDNIGLVTSFSTIKEEEKGLVSVNIGFGYNRINDFYSETTAIGSNIGNSIMNEFAGIANGYTWQSMTYDSNYNPFKGSYAPWAAILAWNTFLIDTISGSNNIYQTALNSSDGVDQEQTLSSTGGIGEFVFSLAANFSNSLYLGATVGLHDVFFSQTTYHNEYAMNGNQPTHLGLFESLDYQQTLSIEGSGINLKIGAIFRPIPSFRIGLAFHTPTYYSLAERYNASMKSAFDVRNESLNSEVNVYDYKVESPFKLIGSFAYTFGTVGLVSIDYEHVDYSTMRFGKGGDGYRFIEENRIIESTFQRASNIRAGGEVWLNNFALRAGYGIYGSPYKKGIEISNSGATILSAGFGFKIDNLLIDWAYQRYTFSDKFKLYSLSPTATRDAKQNKFMLTIGYKF